MVAGNSQQVPRESPRDVTRSTVHHQQGGPQGAVSPLSKRDLTSWWKQFVRNTKKDEVAPAPQYGIFGVPLNVSIKYANVAISLAAEDKSSFIYGYVPIVVAKCGVFLKEKATDVEGIFRLSGSAKRIKDLQEAFDSPDRFGKGLDWTGYTVHDAANILRRYLNQLPEPIVPLDFYESFRDPLRRYQAQAVGDRDAASEEEEGFDHAKAVATYQDLIKKLPPLNRQLLLYILDLLTVFASKSEVNRMTAANLAAIFQPGLLSHPAHDMSPKEYKLSQDVLIFLIENQDNFLFGMTGTAADAQTVKAMQAANAPSTSRSNIRRSASNASGGADSLRKYDVLRRNMSVSSKQSKNSPGNATSPVTPKSMVGASLGVHRSNTVPSKKVAGLSPNHFTRPRDASAPGTGHHSPSNHSGRPSQSPSRTPLQAANALHETAPDTSLPSNANQGLGFVPNAQSLQVSLDEQVHLQEYGLQPLTSPAVGTSTKERKLSAFFRSTAPDGERKDGRQPNRLRKKRPIPGSTSESARSSSHSLHLGQELALGTLVSQAVSGKREGPEDQSQVSTPRVLNPTSIPGAETTSQLNSEAKPSVSVSPENPLKPNRSRTPSMHSRSSVTDHSDFDNQDDVGRERKAVQKRRSWRYPRGTKRHERSELSMSPPPIGSNAHAGFSSSSVGSSNWSPQQNLPNETRQISTETSAAGTVDTIANQSFMTLPTQVSDMSNVMPTSNPNNSIKDLSESERKGFFGKFKAKVAGVKEVVKDREAAKERTKSPPHSDGEDAASRSSLSILPSKEAGGRSMDATRENRLTVNTDSQQPATSAAPPPSTPGPQTPPVGSMVFPGSFPEPTIPEEAPRNPVPGDPTASVTVLPRVEEDIPQSPLSTAEPAEVAAPVQTEPCQQSTLPEIAPTNQPQSESTSS
ncbi:hypothetical protein ACO22_03885 [Paracoccidioides brasiliensis]|uniref:Rho-GAP domain-containing protein n=1 Tax=Paracoccidioides brasiliensis TaxID=121759 RepID=A0A1D2JEP5_PARBR|nr:hypothetical protein ACO22_03885 [Paracoccidioides brasiliensis]